MSKFKRIILFNFLLCTAIVITDQFLKWVMLTKIGLNNGASFLPGLIQFFVVKNTGGAFSIFNQYPVFFKIIGIVNVFIFSYLALCPTVNFNNLIKAGCACVLGGTFSNLIDRFLQNGVVDYLDFQLFNFAVFNVADVSIDIGVLLILIGWYFSKKTKPA